MLGVALGIGISLLIAGLGTLQQAGSSTVWKAIGGCLSAAGVVVLLVCLLAFLRRHRSEQPMPSQGEQTTEPDRASTGADEPQRGTQSKPKPSNDQLRRGLIKELVVIIDEGQRLGDAYVEPSYAAYSLWRDKTAAFIHAVFGGLEHQRFLEPLPQSTGSLMNTVNGRLSRLRALRDRPETWELQVDEASLQRLVDERRSLDPAQRIFAAGSPLAPPELTLGNARIGRWQAISVNDKSGAPMQIGSGRIIRVPVANAQGAGVARDVHATLTFGDSDRQFYPPPAQAEWFGEAGPELTVDLPGNGAERLIDVALVLDGEYPHVFEWTRHSIASGLAGAACMSRPVDIGISVMGSGMTPTLERTLQIEVEARHMIRADWTDRIGLDATNLAYWRDLND
jgi:hypothetical protein